MNKEWAIKKFKLRCPYCHKYFIRKAIRGMTFVFICDSCNYKADYTIPLKDEKQNKRVYEVNEQFEIFSQLKGGKENGKLGK